MKKLLIGIILAALMTGCAGVQRAEVQGEETAYSNIPWWRISSEVSQESIKEWLLIETELKELAILFMEQDEAFRAEYYLPYTFYRNSLPVYVRQLADDSEYNVVTIFMGEMMDVEYRESILAAAITVLHIRSGGAEREYDGRSLRWRNDTWYTWAYLTKRGFHLIF